MIKIHSDPEKQCTWHDPDTDERCKEAPIAGSRDKSACSGHLQELSK